MASYGPILSRSDSLENSPVLSPPPCLSCLSTNSPTCVYIPPLAQGNVFVSQGGGRSVHFTDIETMSQKPSAKGAFGVSLNTYPPPQADSGEWTDTETRVRGL